MSAKVFVFLGPPGVGKGTQCSLLVERLGVKHVSTGSIIREEIAAASELGKQVKDLVQGGGLVEDALLFSCLNAFLHRCDLSSGILLLDGVPRTVSQVTTLCSVLSGMGLEIAGVISLAASTDELVIRFSKRWTCACGNVTSLELEAYANTQACLKCGKVGLFSRREDDQTQVVSRRMEIYRNETEPISEIYRRTGKLREISGLRAVELVYVDVAHCLVEMM